MSGDLADIIETAIFAQHSCRAVSEDFSYSR